MNLFEWSQSWAVVRREAAFKRWVASGYGDHDAYKVFAHWRDVAQALHEYRTAPPGYKIKRRREWVLAVARNLRECHGNGSART